MEKVSGTRSCSLDVVRIFAFFSVVSVHFFMNAWYYGIVVSGWRMYIATLVRTFFMICVPLFMVLSGYLMRKKTASPQYYRKLIRIISEYVLASLTCGLFLFVRVMRAGTLGDIRLFLKEQLFGIFSFSTAPYAWYVEMYIGLFLLIPYINILYNNLEGKRSKQKLLATMLLLTAIPSVTNSLSFGEEAYFHLLPQWWTGLYPITYYFIGAYLSEYPLNLSKAKNLGLIVLTAFVSGTFVFWKNHGDYFVWGSWQDHHSLFCLVQTVLVFTFLSQRSYGRLEKYSKGLAYLSNLCFIAYLVSDIFDTVIGKVLSDYISKTVFRLELYLIDVPVVFVCSLITAAVLHTVYQIGEKCILRFRSKSK